MEAALAVNWLAILVAAVAKFVIGSVWYAPPVFGARWQTLSGIERVEMSGMMPAMVVQFVGDLVMAYMLARFAVHYGAVTLGGGVVVGLMAWVGFVAPIMLGAKFYENRPMPLFYINAGYQLVGIVVMAAIIGAWQ